MGGGQNSATVNQRTRAGKWVDRQKEKRKTEFRPENGAFECLENNRKGWRVDWNGDLGEW